jgi:phosphate:Na+ symporter
LAALEGENEEIVNTVRELEGEIDRLQRVFEANHIRRLENRTCNPLIGIIFVDILRNLERIGDHSTNIANVILLGF